MKWAITADLHLNNTIYGLVKDGMPLKAADSYRAFDFFVDQCVARKVDRVIVAGDIYETPHPSSLFRRMANNRLQKL